MKRVLALLIAFCLLFLLSGCVGKCDNCMKTGKVTKYSVMGSELKLCDNCKEMVNQLTGGLGNALDQLESLTK